MKTKFGIRKKLEVFILPIVTIAFVIVILIAYNSSKSSIEKKTQKLLQAEAMASANTIEAWRSGNVGVLDTAVDTMVFNAMTPAQMLAYEEMYLGTYTDFPNGIYIVLDDGSVIDASGWEPDSDPREEIYYTEGVNCTSGMQFVDAYEDNFTKEFVVTAARYEEAIGGVVCADISLAIMSEVVGGINVDGNGDAFIVDSSTGMVLAHNDASVRGVDIDELDNAFYKEVLAFVNANSGKYSSINSAEGKYMVCYEPIEGTTWSVVVRALEKNIFADVSKLGILLFGVGIAVIIVIVAVLIVLINKITTPIKNITDAIVSVTDGDFTSSVQVSGSDEVAVMGNNLNKFMDVMRGTLGMISTKADEIDAQAKNSRQISGELHESAGGQAEAMKQMLDNLEELVKSIGAIAEDATTLALVVSDTDEAGNRAIANIESTMKEAAAGKNSMSMVNDSMETVKTDMTKLGESIAAVGDAAVKIGDITSAIREIAEQTNLLSLNASIEAARAGEAGKGFAVVATEIKSLAETSGEAADEIAKLIESVTSLINDTVAQSEKSSNRIKESSEMVDNASLQFNSIFKSIESTNDIIHNMIEKVHKTNDVASNMAAITEEQSASAEEIEATAVNVQALADAVTDNSARVDSDSESLAATASELMNKINEFKI